MPNTLEQMESILDGFQHNGLNYTDYLLSDPSASDEAVVRLKVVEPLLTVLGYDLQADLDPEHRQGGNAIDILVKVNDVPVMLWELKRTQDEDLTKHEDQLTRYVLAKGVAHAVLCNGREVRVYQRVGSAVHFSYAVPLTVFASDAATSPSQNDKQALQAFFDAFDKKSFQEIEQQKKDIIDTITPPLVLTPDQMQNEMILIDDLKREIKRLQRFVILRFRSHRQRYEKFQKQKRQNESLIGQERKKLKQWLDNFEQQTPLSTDWMAITTYLDEFTDHWADTKEDEFITDMLNRTGVAQHLNGIRLSNLETRILGFYRVFTDHARWYAQQRIALRPTRTLIEDFEHWREEIGMMAEYPESEFCLQTVYIFVTRLLLIRICEDKGLIKQKISDGGYKSYLEFSRGFFSNIADAHATLLGIAYQDTSYIYGHFFSNDVFDWYTWDEEAIVRLFWTLNRFDFTNVSADLIGRIYEQYVDELERKRKGQFYTPPQVVNYILDQVGYEGKNIIGKRLLDPSCGSGRFLVEAARRLVDVLQKTGIDNKELINKRLRDSLFGMDVNRFACFLAEVNLLVQVLDLLKDGSTFTIDRFHIYPTNTLLSREQETVVLVGAGNGVAYESEVAELIKARGYNPSLGLDFRHGFNYVVGNPPYVSADTPGVSKVRLSIDASGRYQTLYKKWDLYIPFIEFAAQMLADNGKHGYVVSDAYQTEEYGSLSRQFLLDETTIESLTFAPSVKFFDEAQIHNLIYAVSKGFPPDDHKTERYKAVAPMLHSKDIKILPSLSQNKWGEQIFRLAFEGDAGIDFSQCVELGEICYISYGLRPLSADDAPMSFSRDDVLSSTEQAPYTKRFIEGKNIQPYYLKEWQWLEWGTKRVPDHLYRKTFMELYSSPKIIVGETSGVYYDSQGELLDDHSTRNVVPYHSFSTDTGKQYVASVMARQITDKDVFSLDLTPVQLSKLSKTDLAAKVIEARAKISPNYNLRYITALLNCHWLWSYMMDFVRRGSRHRFYPDDLKQWPIAKADADTQSQIANLVDEIMSAKADIQGWRDAGHYIGEDGVLLNPRPYLDTWNINHGDLIDASSFLDYNINGHITTIEREGQRLNFRKRPHSYIESQHDHVLDYLALYLETNRDALGAIPTEQMVKEIRIPRSLAGVQTFLDKLEVERERVMLRWMAAAQHENLIDEWAFDLYNVANDQREKLSGVLYILEGVPGSADFVSILDNANDSAMRRVAFQKSGDWCYRTDQTLPNAVHLWIYDGGKVITKYGVVGTNGFVKAS